MQLEEQLKIMPKYKDIRGKTYGYLTAIRYSYSDHLQNAVWVCRCKCGNHIETTYKKLRERDRTSCGCFDSKITHGLTKHRLYRTWRGIINRCLNQKVKSYKYYGGRGIKICDEWLNKNDGFITFYNWSIANGWQEGLTIERKDVNGNYEPDNCCWIPLKEQGGNTRSNLRGYINGEFITLREAYKKYRPNISINTITKRVHYGWELGDALFTGLRERRRKKLGGNYKCQMK